MHGPQFSNSNSSLVAYNGKYIIPVISLISFPFVKEFHTSAEKSDAVGLVQ